MRRICRLQILVNIHKVSPEQRAYMLANLEQIITNALRRLQCGS